jgi:hypothetical protein
MKSAGPTWNTAKFWIGLVVGSVASFAVYAIGFSSSPSWAFGAPVTMFFAKLLAIVILMFAGEKNGMLAAGIAASILVGALAYFVTCGHSVSGV